MTMRRDAYLQAADEMLVVAGVGTAEPSDNLDTAKRKLGKLIDWHVAVALDERVNGGYRLVPVEATPLTASIIEQHMDSHGDGAVAWRAALLAAPKPGDPHGHN